MKRIVAFVQAVNRGQPPADSPSPDPAIRRSRPSGRSAATGKAQDAAELKLEALLSDGQAQRIVDSLLAVDGRSQIDSLIDELLDVGLALAGAEARDLHERIVGAVERQLIERVYAECGRMKKRASARLGINRNTLYKKLRHHQLDTGPQ
jgi:DNA-binding protein Fis